MSCTPSFYVLSLKIKSILQASDSNSTQDDYALSLDGSNITDGFVLSLDGSNNKHKDVTTNAAPCSSRQELLSETNVFNARTDSMIPQNQSMFSLNNNTLPPIDEMILPLCINTLPLPDANYLLQQQHVSAMPTPASPPSSRYSLLKRADQVPPSESRSVRGWSGALNNNDQSLPNLKDVRGALCQM